MKKCSNEICGKEFPEEYDICPFCGTELPEIRPDKIYVQVENIWFSMLKIEDYYATPCIFPLWWVLMPNLTWRDIRYANYAIQLDEIASGDIYGNLEDRVKRIPTFMERLRLSTGLPFSLLHNNDPNVSAWRDMGQSFYDPNDGHSCIWFKLPLSDYQHFKERGCASILGIQDFRWGVISEDGRKLNQDDSLMYLNNLIQKRYNGLY